MKLIRSKWQLNPQGNYLQPVARESYLHRRAAYLFDQQGYAFTRLERDHAIVNGFAHALDLHQTGEWTMKLPWFIDEDPPSNIDLNHAMLIERKGFEDEALERLTYFAHQNPLLWKLVKMKPKWGVDISVDYSSEEAAFEVFHFEWDSFKLSETEEMQAKIEEFVENADFEDMAKRLWAKKDEWNHLDYDKMSDYKCDFFGIPRERYKMANWHNERLY